MKAVAISTLAFVASVQAAGWQDAPVEPVKSTATTEASKTWSDATWSTTTTEPVKEATQSYCKSVAAMEAVLANNDQGGDEEVVESATTTEYPSKETDKPVEGGEGHTWSDAPVVETTTVIEHTWSDYAAPTPSPEKPVEGGKDHTWTGHAKPTPSPEKPVEGGKDHTWSDVEVPSEKTSTTVVTGTITETKWIDVAPATPVSPATPLSPEAPKTWEEAPVPTDVSPAKESSTWLDWASTAAGADECVVTVITKYGKPTWTPDSGVAKETWVDAAVPETTPVAGETPATWVDVKVPATSTASPVYPTASTSATWADAPAPTQPASPVEGKPWEDVPSNGECSESTVTEEVTVTYTITAEHTWADVPAKPTEPVSDEADHTWADVPAEPTETVSVDEEAEHTWADVPAEPTKPADVSKPVHGGKGKPTTTTTPAVETSTWADYTVSTTEPSKETTTWSKPSKPSTTTEEKPTSPEETQAYWGDAQ